MLPDGSPVPPPPAPARTRRAGLLAAGAVGVVIGVGAMVAVIVLTDDDPDAPVGTAATSAPTPSGAGNDGEGGLGEETPAAPTTTAPLPEPTFASLEAMLYPDNVGVLGENLDRLGFPAWWWLPESVARPDAARPTVARVEVEDYVLTGGVTTSGGYERSTTWFLPVTDVAAVEAEVLAAVPGDEFDLDRGRADRQESQRGGLTEVEYLFPSRSGALTDSLLLQVAQVASAANSAPDGIEASLTLTVAVDDPPAAVPTGPGDERAFLAAAPVSGIIRWNRTSFLAVAAPSVGASGSYSAAFTAPVDGLDRVVAFLSDPANFGGPLELVQPGRFTTDDLWEQPMAFGELLGHYEVLKPSVGAANDLFITLSFPLT
jgi:hypothetical protein